MARASTEGVTRRHRERRDAMSSKPPSFFSRRATTSVTSNVAPSDAAKRAAASSSRSYAVSSAEPTSACRLGGALPPAVSAFAMEVDRAVDRAVERTPLTLSFAAR